MNRAHVSWVFMAILTTMVLLSQIEKNLPGAVPSSHALLTWLLPLLGISGLSMVIFSAKDGEINIPQTIRRHDKPGMFWAFVAIESSLGLSITLAGLYHLMH